MIIKSGDGREGFGIMSVMPLAVIVFFFIAILVLLLCPGRTSSLEDHSLLGILKVWAQTGSTTAAGGW